MKQSVDSLDKTLFGDLPRALQAKDVIELYGKEGSGKTQILIHLIANCILPKTWEGLIVNGRGVSVVFFDTDNHFSLVRLVEILEDRVTCCISRHVSGHEVQRTTDMESFVKSCLSRLVIVQCNSSIELLATLESLDYVLSERPEICLLMIDSIVAFYWLDKCNGGDSIYEQERYQRRLVALLKKYIHTYNLIVVATKPAIFHKEVKQHNAKEHYEYLCRDWQDLVKYRYSVSRASDKSSTLLFKRILPSGKSSLQFSIGKGGMLFSDSSHT